MPDDTPARPVTAPEFPEDLVWWNTDRPLTLEQMRGRIVLLFFWSAGSIPCQLAASDLRKVWTRHENELVIVGVHTPRFEREKDPATVGRAIQRQGIEFPVVHDPDARIHGLYTVTECPAYFLIDPAGEIRGHATGERAVDALDEVIAEIAAEFDAGGALNRRPIAGIPTEISPEDPGAAPLGMRFPGKVLADESGGRLFIADSGRHRILEVDLESGRLLRVIGGGVATAGEARDAAGFVDGSFERARFRHPQGMALRKDLVLVADSGNHAIREIDLRREVVRTVVGTGFRPTREGAYGARWPGRHTALSSPWDVIVVGETLYVAMAGCRQIWRLDLDTDEVALHAGSGRAVFEEGHHAQAGLLRPSGLTTDGRALYIADAEASSILRAGLGTDGEIEVLAGGGRDGAGSTACAGSPAGASSVAGAGYVAGASSVGGAGFANGAGGAARFQYPLGVVWHQGRLLVADTYNNAIRSIDPVSREVRTLVGVGGEGAGSGAGAGGAILLEPGGVEVAGPWLYVADTANHRVRRFRAADGAADDWSIHLPAARDVDAPIVDAVSEDLYPDDHERELREVRMPPGEARVLFELRLPAGYELNRTAPFELTAEGDGNVVGLPGGGFQLRTGDPRFPVPIALHLAPGQGWLRVAVVLYYCEAPAERLCFYQLRLLRVPIRVTAEATSREAPICLELEAPSAPI